MKPQFVLPPSSKLRSEAAHTDTTEQRGRDYRGWLESSTGQKAARAGQREDLALRWAEPSSRTWPPKRGLSWSALLCRQRRAEFPKGKRNPDFTATRLQARQGVSWRRHPARAGSVPGPAHRSGIHHIPPLNRSRTGARRPVPSARRTRLRGSGPGPDQVRSGTWRISITSRIPTISPVLRPHPGDRSSNTVPTIGDFRVTQAVGANHSLPGVVPKVMAQSATITS